MGVGGVGRVREVVGGWGVGEGGDMVDGLGWGGGGQEPATPYASPLIQKCICSAAAASVLQL